MLTETEKATQAETGLIPPSRMAALAHAFRCKADDLRAKSAAAGIDSRAAAALRGMATSYSLAARDVDRVREGRPLRPHRQSSSRRKSRAARDARQGRAA